MLSVRQRSADFFVRYAKVDADRQGVTGPLDTFSYNEFYFHEMSRQKLRKHFRSKATCLVFCYAGLSIFHETFPINVYDE